MTRLPSLPTMPPRFNLTYPTALVLLALSRGYRYGFDIMDATGLASGTVYPLLRRLEGLGLAAAGWESEEAAHREGRPARRYYELTSEGAAALADARRKLGALALRTDAPPGPHPSPA